MKRARTQESSRLKSYYAEHIRIAIGVTAWLLMGLIGLALEAWEFKLWLTYVM
jgi:hypothetical protein